MTGSRILRCQTGTRAHSHIIFLKDNPITPQKKKGIIFSYGHARVGESMMGWQFRAVVLADLSAQVMASVHSRGLSASILSSQPLKG